MVLLAFLSTFAGSLTITTTPTVKGLEAAAVAGGMAAIYVLIKQLGGVQAVSGVLKVKVPK